jgi:hypothetical protein
VGITRLRCFSSRKTEFGYLQSKEGACGDREIKVAEEEFDGRRCTVKTEILEVLKVDCFE